MQRLDGATAARWCESRLRSESLRSVEDIKRAWGQHELAIVEMPGMGLQLVDFANWLCAHDVHDGRPAQGAQIVWLVDWDIWSAPRERVGLRLLHAMLGGSDVKARPAVVFERDEQGAAAALVTLVGLFQWDAIVLPAHGEFAVFLSHHGTAEFRFRSSDARATLQPGLTHFSAREG